MIENQVLDIFFDPWSGGGVKIGIMNLTYSNFPTHNPVVVWGLELNSIRPGKLMRVCMVERGFKTVPQRSLSSARSTITVTDRQNALQL